MEMFNFGPSVTDLLQAAFDKWNDIIAIVFELLSLSPEAFADGALWELVEKINPIFVAVASPLIVIFFVIGFCAESVDIREEMRFEVILRFLIRLGIGEWLVVNNLAIIKAVFASAGNLVKLLDFGTYAKIEMPDEIVTTFNNLNFVQGLVMLVFAAIIVLIVIVCGFFILYTVYFRFLKITAIIPMGALASATAAGNRMVSNTAVAYFKYCIATALEAVTMALAIIMCNALLSKGLPELATDLGTWTQCLVYLFEMVFSVALTVGSVKGAQALTGKVLGLTGG